MFDKISYVCEYKWKLACTDDTTESHKTRLVCPTKEQGIQRMKELNKAARQHGKSVRWFLVNRDIVKLMYACDVKE